MNEMDVIRYYKNIIQSDKEISIPLAVIQTLLHLLKEDKSKTIQELMEHIQNAIKYIRNLGDSATSVSSAGELFLRFITLASLENPDLSENKKIMIKRGEQYLNHSFASREKISQLGKKFITDGKTILTHSRSKVVRDTFIQAAKDGINFHVYVTESQPACSGYELQKELEKFDISCTVILDAAVAYIMEKIDVIMLGAEGVVEGGGVINKLGTYSLAISAETFNKPVYVLAESIKFIRLHPLRQTELPNSFNYSVNAFNKHNITKKLNHPEVDYTPPKYITLLVTDRGILTTAAVSDELMKLYL